MGLSTRPLFPNWLDEHCTTARSVHPAAQGGVLVRTEPKNTRTFISFPFPVRQYLTCLRLYFIKCFTNGTFGSEVRFLTG